MAHKACSTQSLLTSFYLYLKKNQDCKLHFLYLSMLVSREKKSEVSMMEAAMHSHCRNKWDVSLRKLWVCHSTARLDLVSIMGSVAFILIGSSIHSWQKLFLSPLLLLAFLLSIVMVAAAVNLYQRTIDNFSHLNRSSGLNLTHFKVNRHSKGRQLPWHEIQERVHSKALFFFQLLNDWLCYSLIFLIEILEDTSQ